MKELQRRQKLRRAIYSWPSLIILFLITFMLAKGAWGVMVKERESKSKVENLESQALALESREADLIGDIERLKTPEGVEEEIRDKYSATREGEFVAIIIDEETEASTTEKTTGEIIKGWWNKLEGLWRE